MTRTNFGRKENIRKDNISLDLSEIKGVHRPGVEALKLLWLTILFEFHCIPIIWGKERKSLLTELTEPIK